jgi:hypothetical protein
MAAPAAVSENVSRRLIADGVVLVLSPDLGHPPADTLSRELGRGHGDHRVEPGVARVTGLEEWSGPDRVGRRVDQVPGVRVVQLGQNVRRDNGPTEVRHEYVRPVVGTQQRSGIDDRHPVGAAQ